MDLASYFQDSTLLLTIAGALIIVYWLQILVTNLQFPAGPWGLPFIGYQPFVANDPADDLSKLAKKYGDIFSIKIGSRTNIILSSYEMNREFFVKNSDNFTGVVKEFNMRSHILEADKSMFQDEGDSWKEQRRFFMSCLREFGVGRVKTEKNIHIEAENMLHTLRDYDSQPIDFVNSYLLRLMTFNIASSVAFGRRFEYDDKKLIRHIKGFDDFISYLLTNTVILDRLPILRLLPNRWTGLEEVYRRKKVAFAFMYELVKEHEEDFDANNIRDITDLYLKKRAEIKESGCDPDETKFSITGIVINVAFLVMAGTEDSSVALSWFLKLAAKYPETQKKMQEEMDRVIGRQKLPCWTDRGQLPYVDAFLSECMRFASFLPLSMPHTNYEAVTINGHSIPKRTVVQSNYWHINHDPEVWGDPEEFRPERFIGEDGKLNKMKDRVLSFGSGTRSCPGESLGRMELFIFITAIIQNFTLRPPPEEEDFNFNCSPGTQRRLHNCVLCAEPLE